MKRLAILFLIATIASASALTKKERAVVERALEGIKAAITLSESQKAELEAARKSVADANNSADLAKASAEEAGNRAVTAEKQAKEQHDELVRAARENAEMRPVYAQVNKWCGLGAIIYGIGRILHCAMWIGIGVAIIAAILLAISISTGTNLFGIIGGLWNKIFRRKT